MKEENLAIIILGAPGSGKGTQAKMLSENTDFVKYTMSDMIRNSVEEDKNILKKVKQGILLDDVDIFKIFKDNFGFEDKVILDGIPRTQDQSYWLYGLLKTKGYQIKVFYLDVERDFLLDRILLRSQKEGRSDDNKEIFNRRFEDFNKVKDMIIDIYKEDFVKFNGSKSEAEIQNELLKKLKELL